jgi:GTP pyrophosphokinase
MSYKNHIIQKAYEFAIVKHSGQTDDAGFNYVESHLQQVVGILIRVTGDENILAAAYLHDTIEDTDTTYDELVENFGNKIADLVMEVTHDGEKDTYGRYFPRLHSQEAIMIKFADRLSNISRMENWSEKRKAQYLRKSKFWSDGSDRLSEIKPLTITGPIKRIHFQKKKVFYSEAFSYKPMISLYVKKVFPGKDQEFPYFQLISEDIFKDHFEFKYEIPMNRREFTYFYVIHRDDGTSSEEIPI